MIGNPAVINAAFAIYILGLQADLAASAVRRFVEAAKQMERAAKEE